jgi:hypothetical protein
MRTYLRQNLLWYIAVAFVLGPYVLLNAFDLGWIVRMLAATLFMVSGGSMLLYWGLRESIVTSEMRGNGPLVRRFGQRRVALAIRVILVAFGALLLIPYLISVGSDIEQIMEGRGPLVRVGTVTRTNWGFVVKNIVLDEQVERKQDSFFAWYFRPREIMVGDRYEFVYLPNTRQILEARIIEKQL